MTAPANRSTPPRSGGGGVAPPAHPAGAAWALFLDFDGALVELAMTPDAVVITSKWPTLSERGGGGDLVTWCQQASIVRV